MLGNLYIYTYKVTYTYIIYIYRYTHIHIYIYIFIHIYIVILELLEHGMFKMIPILVRIFEGSIFYLLQDEHTVQYPWDAMEHKIFQTPGGKNTKKLKQHICRWDILQWDMGIEHITGISWNMIGI